MNVQYVLHIKQHVLLVRVQITGQNMSREEVRLVTAQEYIKSGQLQQVKEVVCKL